MDGFAPVALAGGLVYASGMTPSPAVFGEGIDVQVADVLGRLDQRLVSAGSSLARAVSLHVQVRRASDFAAMNVAYARSFVADPPVRTTVVAPPERPGALVEVSAVAAIDASPRNVLRPPGWPPSPNPYSYAIRCGDIVFLSGLVPRDGRTNTVVAGDLPTQVAVIFDNASDVLRSAGLSLADVVSARVFLTDPADVPALDALYRQRFSVPRPARTTVVAALMNAQYRVEMTFIAAIGGHRPATTGGHADALASPAVVAGSRVFLSASDGTDEAGAADIETHVRRAAARLGDTLRDTGLEWPDVVDVTLCVTDPRDAPAARRTLREATGRALPAGSTLVCGLVGTQPHPGGPRAHGEARVQVTATAVRP
jgi:2-iminobutanoate/2-iminopropanoate deaminase